MQKNILDIPGWMNEKELIILSTLAGYVPDQGSILEIGCFLGSSTTALYNGKKSTVSVDVVDCFRGFRNPALVEKPFKELRFGLGKEEFYYQARTVAIEQGWEQAFKYCIGDAMYNDISTYPTTSKEFIKNKSYNLTFIDASHTEEDVTFDINKYISDTDLLIGDDYHPWYNGVPIALNQTRDKRTLIVFENTKLWALIPKIGYWRDVFKNNNLLFL